jgi:hypothetical protein
MWCNWYAGTDVLVTDVRVTDLLVTDVRVDALKELMCE